MSMSMVDSNSGARTAGFRRTAPAALLGACATLALLLLMVKLIEDDAAGWVDAVQHVPVELLVVREDTPPVRTPKKPERPVVVEIEPDLRIALHDPGPSVGDGFTTMPRPPIEVTPGVVGTREPIAVLRPAPIYPPRAITRGIEGWVLLVFDVSESGATSNVRVVEAQPAGVFENAAIGAVQRYRYQPLEVNGVAQAVTGLQNLIHFELTK